MVEGRMRSSSLCLHSAGPQARHTLMQNLIPANFISLPFFLPLSFWQDQWSSIKMNYASEKSEMCRFLQCICREGSHLLLYTESVGVWLGGQNLIFCGVRLHKLSYLELENHTTFLSIG